MMGRVVCVAMALCVVSAAQAQTVLQTVNGALVAQGASPQFCLPPNLVLEEEQAADIVTRTAAKAVRNIDDLPIAIILLRGLKETFPCDGQGK